MHKDELNSERYFNIHTHLPGSTHQEVSVYILSQDDLISERVNSPYSCAGIHPWWPEDIDNNQIEKLKISILNLLEAGKIWGVGETGIDRLYPEYLDLQKELFQWHLELANKYQKPLIVHNVRAGSDFLEIIKAEKPQTPWLFHDFRGNMELVDSLLKLHEDCYFSFGISLDNSQTVRDVIKEIPIDRIFLETDVQKHLDIHDVYIRACKELKLDLPALKEQIYNNFLRFEPSIH